MATYIGFSTININMPRIPPLPLIDGGPGSILSPLRNGKKFRMVDERIVLQDFINALNIPQGQKVGNPKYGTTLWSFIFEPNTADVQYQLQAEIKRVAELDPRLTINAIHTYSQDHGILIEIELAILPFNNAQLMSVFFNQQTNTATIR